MSPLYRLLLADRQIDFRMILSGSHLSSHSNYSKNQIYADGVDVLLEVETMLHTDTAISRVKSAGILLQSCLETVAAFSPDLVVYAGDREDVLIYAMISGYLGIPSVHVYAGDHVADGYVDNPVRHATSKLSTAHFTCLEEHSRRLVQMGESPDRVFCVGNISLDNFLNFKPIALREIESEFSLDSMPSKYALVIFHPVTSEIPDADDYFENILMSLRSEGMHAFISYPNVDPGNSRILKVIEKYTGCPDFIFYKNLDRDVFLTIYSHSKFIIGNSSSGILEAASFKIPAINVGLRQRGRFAGSNVVFCGPGLEEIGGAVRRVMSEEFQGMMKDIINPYGDGHSAKRAYDIIKRVDFESMKFKTEDPLGLDVRYE